MKRLIHIYLPALLLVCLSADSQKISKSDKGLLANLQTHIQTLSADTAGGRTMGTPGEKAVADYLISALSNAGARPKGDNNGWLQTFTVDEGRQIGPDAVLTIDDHSLLVGREWFPLSLSPAGEVKGSPAIALPESGVPWFQDLKEWLEAGAASPRFDLMATIRSKAAACARKGATALILYNSAPKSERDKLGFDPKDKTEAAVIPVVYITREAKQKYLKDESASADIRIRVSYTSQHRTGHNVVGFLDNGAHETVVIGSRYENTGGMAAMIELARMLAGSKLRGNNYLFVVFSESRQGWPGSEYYIDHPAIDLHSVNYLLELNWPYDLNGSHPLNIGGSSASGAWSRVGDKQALSAVTFRYDSSAVQPGDHAAFYRRHIPMLVFSAERGPSDGPNDNFGELQVVKFIYSVIEGADARGSL